MSYVLVGLEIGSRHFCLEDSLSAPPPDPASRSVRTRHVVSRNENARRDASRYTFVADGLIKTLLYAIEIRSQVISTARTLILSVT
jgi:hypothetical protein